MKIFFMGDTYSNNGPSNVNKVYKQFAPSLSIFSSNSGKIKRLLEIASKVKKCDVLCFLNYSKMNIFAAKKAKSKNKRIVYLMHGCDYYESKINKNEFFQNFKNGEKKLQKVFNREKEFLLLVDKVICVSAAMEKQAIEYYPFLVGKTAVVHNGFNWAEFENESINSRRGLVSTGGGFPQKNNIKVCEAIEKINDDLSNLEYTIIDNPMFTEKRELIKSYNFVDYKMSLSHSELLNIFKTKKIYIQNSYFESYGIAPIEALFCGCDLLLSNKAGVLEIINGITNDDIIFDNNDSNEIAIKIQNLLKNGNNVRLRMNLKQEELSYENTSKHFFEEVLL